MAAWQDREGQASSPKAQVTGLGPRDRDADGGFSCPPDANLRLKTRYFHLEQETQERGLGEEGSVPGVPPAGLTRCH